MKIVVDSLEGLSAAAEKFLEAAKGHRVFAFHAQMGAGKTTFIAELCRRLGVGDESASPTFSILNEYRSRTSGEPICHFDFYRLESPEEAFDIGAEDYFYSGCYCFVEWPEVVEPILPPGTVDVEITVDSGTGSRTIDIKGL